MNQQLKVEIIIHMYNATNLRSKFYLIFLIYLICRYSIIFGMSSSKNGGQKRPRSVRMKFCAKVQEVKRRLKHLFSCTLQMISVNTSYPVANKSSQST